MTLKKPKLVDNDNTPLESDGSYIRFTMRESIVTYIGRDLYHSTIDNLVIFNCYYRIWYYMNYEA